MLFFSPSRLALVGSVLSGVSLAAYIPISLRDSGSIQSGPSDSNHTGLNCPMPPHGSGEIAARGDDYDKAIRYQRDWKVPMFHMGRNARNLDTHLSAWASSLPREYGDPNMRDSSRNQGSKFCRDFVRSMMTLDSKMQGLVGPPGPSCGVANELRMGNTMWTMTFDDFKEGYEAVGKFMKTVDSLDSKQKKLVTGAAPFPYYYEALVAFGKYFEKQYDSVRGVRNKFNLPKQDWTFAHLPKKWEGSQ